MQYADSPAVRAQGSQSCLAARLRNVAIICVFALCAAFIGALLAEWQVDRTFAAIRRAAFARTVDLGGAVSIVGTLAAAMAAIEHGLRTRAAWRRRYVTALRSLRERFWLVHLLWLPALAVIVFSEGPTLLIALGLPIVLAGILWFASTVSGRSRDLGVGAIAQAVFTGFVLGYVVGG